MLSAFRNRGIYALVLYVQIIPPEHEIVNTGKEYGAAFAAPLSLDGTGNHKSGNAGSECICPGYRVLGVGGGRNSDLPRIGGEQAGSLVVVILHTLRPCCAVKGFSRS